MPRNGLLNFFPIMVNLHGKKCLVVGAGTVATEKIAGLLAYGAEVTVISPQAKPGIQARARTGVIQWKKRRFASNAVRGMFLVIAATSSRTVNSAVFNACHKNGALCNSVDDPENCDFFYPAVVRRGPLQIAISTNGNSPALASRLRRELEKQFGPKWAKWVEELGQKRRRILTEDLPESTRRKELLKMATPASFRAYARKQAAGKQSSRTHR